MISIVLLTLAVILAGDDAAAQGPCDTPCQTFCSSLDQRAAYGAPWHVEQSKQIDADTCWCYCCDVTNRRGWQETAPLPSATTTPRPTRRPTATVTPTVTPRPTRRPTATVTPTVTPPPTRRPTAAPATPAETPAVTQETAATPAFAPPATDETPRAGQTPSPPAAAPSTSTPVTAMPTAAVDAGRNCIPTHAAAPIRLCPTQSGSGWWVYDSATGQILANAHGALAYVPFPASLPAGRARVLFVSPRLLILWLDNHVLLSTQYSDGKEYVFSILKNGRIAHWQW